MLPGSPVLDWSSPSMLSIYIYVYIKHWLKNREAQQLFFNTHVDEFSIQSVFQSHKIFGITFLIVAALHCFCIQTQSRVTWGL